MAITYHTSLGFTFCWFFNVDYCRLYFRWCLLHRQGAWLEREVNASASSCSQRRTTQGAASRRKRTRLSDGDSQCTHMMVLTASVGTTWLRAMICLVFSALHA